MMIANLFDRATREWSIAQRYRQLDAATNLRAGSNDDLVWPAR